MSSTEIAKRENLPVSTASLARKKLEQTVIDGYTIIIDSAKIGIESYQLNIKLSDVGVVEYLFEFAKEHENIIVCIETLGKWDVELILETKNMKEAQQTLIALRTQFSNAIEDIELLALFEDYLKFDHYPFNQRTA